MNPHIEFIPKVIPLKFFLDMVPSSSADVTRALGGCFRGETEDAMRPKKWRTARPQNEISEIV